MKGNNIMKIKELLDRLDGEGLIVTDEELLEKALLGMGVSLETRIRTETSTK